jgi:hypothetical protein
MRTGNPLEKTVPQHLPNTTSTHVLARVIFSGKEPVGCRSAPHAETTVTRMTRQFSARPTSHFDDTSVEDLWLSLHGSPTPAARHFTCNVGITQDRTLLPREVLSTAHKQTVHYQRTEFPPAVSHSLPTTGSSPSVRQSASWRKSGLYTSSPQAVHTPHLAADLRT